MGTVAGGVIGANRSQCIGLRHAHPGIDEQHCLSPLQIQCVLDLKLKIFQQLKFFSHLPGIQPIGQTRQQQRPERIVATTGVAAGKYDKRRSDSGQLRLN